MPAARITIPADFADARPVVDGLLQEAISAGASDIHVEPTAAGYEVKFRVDGLLETAAQYDAAPGRSIVSRFMVMSQLLTYRLDIPQEGRFSFLHTQTATALDIRVAVMPTTHGLRAALRLPAELLQPKSLDQLQLHSKVSADLKAFAAGDAGMLIVTGPAGSGKTTTVYALLQYIARTTPGISIIALEDPVERDLAGVTQIEVSPFGQLTYERALRSILRQDPQVLMLGEIRDAATATLALQAALSGHRLISTFHASTAAGAIARLIEMGAEPYQITSAVYGIVSQRLIRRADKQRGRLPLAEFVKLDEAARAAILRRDTAQGISAQFAKQIGFKSIRESAQELIASGQVESADVERVLGTG